MANSTNQAARHPMSPPDAGAQLTERRLAAWIGKALRVEGRIVSAEDLTIDGSVEGSIELGNHSLTIGPGATVKAESHGQECHDQRERDRKRPRHRDGRSARHRVGRAGTSARRSS